MMPSRTIGFLLSAITIAFAGESSLTSTFQPLDGLGSGRITITEVACHDWYSHSGLPTAIGLISAANVPPTNNPKQATENLNLASVCKLVFHYQNDYSTPQISLDASEFTIPKRFAYSRIDILRSTLECLRRCLPDDLQSIQVTLRASEDNRQWMSDVIRDFNLHDRRTAFFTDSEQK